MDIEIHGTVLYPQINSFIDSQWHAVNLACFGAFDCRSPQIAVEFENSGLRTSYGQE